jgi:hypothetical protein
VEEWQHQNIKNLEEINQKVSDIAAMLKQPQSKFANMLNVIAAEVGVLGILSIIDIIKNWILRG